MKTTSSYFKKKKTSLFSYAHLHMCIPPANKACELIRITISVCLSFHPSVCPSVFVNSCPVHKFCLEKHWRFLLNVNIAYALTMCHDIDPISFGQDQGSWQGNCKICVSSYSYLWRNIRNSLHKYCLLPEGVSIN